MFDQKRFPALHAIVVEAYGDNTWSYNEAFRRYENDRTEYSCLGRALATWATNELRQLIREKQAEALNAAADGYNYEVHLEAGERLGFYGVRGYLTRRATELREGRDEPAKGE